MRKASAVSVFALAALLAIGATIYAAESSVPQSPPIPEAQIPAPIKAAVNAADRPAADKTLDAGRQPEQILAFYGIAPGMNVADLVASGGYTTELLSRVVGPAGKVYSQNGTFPPRFKKTEIAWKNRLKEPALADAVAVSNLRAVKAGSLDAVVMHLNYHDLVWLGVDRDQLNASVFKALKPGGVYGIVDHSAQVGSGIRDVKTLHRIDENFVVKEIEKAGFKLAATSSALRHPEDDRTWLVFEHRGATDRFMLKFVKP